MKKIRLLIERIRFEWNYKQAVIEMQDALTQARKELAERI